MTNRRYKITLYLTNGLVTEPIYVDSYEFKPEGLALVTRSASTVLILTCKPGDSWLITDTEAVVETT